MADTPKTIALEFKGYWLEARIAGLPKASGVYAVFSCTHDATANTVTLKKLLYIGESTNVNERLANHPGWTEWKRQLLSGQVLAIACATVSTVDRERTEAAMIFHHQPPCNSSFKDSFPFDTTTVTTSGKNQLLSANLTVRKDARK